MPKAFLRWSWHGFCFENCIIQFFFNFLGSFFARFQIKGVILHTKPDIRLGSGVRKTINLKVVDMPKRHNPATNYSM